MVASRTVPDDGTAQAIWEDPLPGVGTYRFRLYLNGSGTAVETKVFEAQFCLVVTKSCQLISFFNPPTNDAVAVEYFIINEDPSGDFVLQPGARQHISWAHFGDMFGLRWSGRTAAGDPAGRRRGVRRADGLHPQPAAVAHLDQPAAQSRAGRRGRR